MTDAPRLPIRPRRVASPLVCLSSLALLLGAATPAASQDWETARAVTITRTDFGVPHVEGPSLRHVFFGLAYAQAEDHGERVVEGFVRARGHMARLEGTEANIRSDVTRRQTYALAVETWDQLDPDVRSVMEGFAGGLNHYLALHPDEQPEGVPLDFTGVDAHALTIGWWDAGRARRFVEARMAVDSSASAFPSTLGTFPDEDFIHPEDGSNAWALAPSRTRGQRAILLRNPHLSWDAGYYEAHVRVPGQLDFYGDFRVGGLFGIVAGFNRDLGWATTNNGPDLSVIYRLPKRGAAPGHYLLDGLSQPVRTQQMSVEVVDTGPDGARRGERVETRDVRTTDAGPIIHEDAEAYYVIRSADHGEFRRGEQFLAMMQAGSFDEFQAAMRMQRISASNYTYADRAGNIFYVWNAKLPRLPHRPVDPLRSFTARSAAEMWTEFHPFDSLPQLLNPESGYLRNENDPPYFTNLDEVLDPAWFPPNMPEPRLRLRSQNSLRILASQERFTLEDVVEAKHTMSMMLAERVKDDLLAAVRVTDASRRAREGASILDDWDNSVSREARGGVLFAAWWDEYTARVDSARVFRVPWSYDHPTGTPSGLGDPQAAAQAFEVAVGNVLEQYGSLDVAWGDVHRVRHGRVDVPVGGCTGALGCFRVLGFGDAENGLKEVRRGDGWVLAVEFGAEPRAYSVLAYGQSSRELSPHQDDQAALFASNRMKPVAFLDRDIDALMIERYVPGERRE